MEKEIYIKCLQALKTINYSRQDHWDIFDKSYYKKISDFNEMTNFRNNGISNMLETGLPSQDRQDLILNNKAYNISYTQNEKDDIIKRFNQLNTMIGKDLDKYFCNTLIGNPRHLKYHHNSKDYILNFDDLYHVYAAWQIKRYIDFKKIKTNNVLEIGGGYGNLCRKIKRLIPDSTYFIVDIPEVLLIQHYYLSSNSNLKILNLINENKDNYKDYDVILLPFYMLKKIDLNPDIVINCRSFGEMPKNTLLSYFEWIHKNLRNEGFLYMVNRYVFTKSIDKNKIRDYPFDNRWSVILSQPQWLQTHLHEFLLKRVEKENNDLNYLLKSFPIETPPPGPIMEKILTQKSWIENQIK